MADGPPDQLAARAFGAGEVIERALTDIYAPAKRVFFTDALRRLKTDCLVRAQALRRREQVAHLPEGVEVRHGCQPQDR